MLVIFQDIKEPKLVFPEARWMPTIAVKLQRQLIDQPLCG